MPLLLSCSRIGLAVFALVVAPISVAVAATPFPDMTGAPLYPVQQHEWTLQPSLFVADTLSNTGYLIGLTPTDRGYPVLAFIIGSGRPSVVRYIGRVYDATTPERRWVVKSIHTKGDRITFGKTGRFLRLYDDEGATYTPYGIHATSNIDYILSLPSDMRFMSMGCILVSDDILSLLIDTFNLGDNALSVKTMKGVDAIQPTLSLFSANWK